MSDDHDGAERLEPGVVRDTLFRVIRERDEARAEVERLRTQNTAAEAIQPAAERDAPRTQREPWRLSEHVPPHEVTVAEAKRIAMKAGADAVKAWADVADRHVADASARSRLGGWIQTFSGVQFWPLAPAAEDVCLMDIAHALSNLCRFGGHCERFYSVAEHSCLVARHCAGIGGNDLALAGLMHDAAEAYLIDLPRPLKQQLRDYREIERQLEAVIAERFGLAYPTPTEVGVVDKRALMAERLALLGPEPAPWEIETVPLAATPRCLAPAEAREAFLADFVVYGGIA